MPEPDFSRERVIERLRLAKGMALRQKKLKAVTDISRSLAKAGDEGLFTEQEAAELDLLVERECVQTALYHHYDKDGVLLYVGISVRAAHRTSQHKSKSHWFCSVTRIEIEWFPAYSLAVAAERHAIKAEKPVHNILHNARTPKP